MKEFNSELVDFKLKLSEKVAIIEFELKKNLEPEDLKKIKLIDPVKEKFSSKLVILSGRAPIWFYAYLIHFYHPVKGIAVYDPRYDKAIVTESHTKDFSVGDLIEIF